MGEDGKTRPGRWRAIRVPEEAAGARVDAWLAGRFGNWSRSAVGRLIAAGEIRGEDRRLKPSSRLRGGEGLAILMPDDDPEAPPPPLPPVLHEDDRLLVVDKPAGMLCHAAGRRFVWGLIAVARHARPGVRLDLVHRLDRETSGVVVITKDLDANVFLKERFRLGEGVRKRYLALCRGVPGWDRRVVDAPIGDAVDSEIRIRRGVGPHGRPARTTFEVVRRLDGLALLRCRLHTGRTHQIRVHLEHIGHPLLGDKMYGQPDRVFLHHLDHGADAAVRRAVGFPRHALHAAWLELPHPDGGVLTVEAPLPADMAAVVAGEPPRWPDP